VKKDQQFRPQWRKTSDFPTKIEDQLGVLPLDVVIRE
jgi:hypothetical protein